MTDRRASVIWEGDLPTGKGVATFESSGLADDVAVSWPSRAEEPNGQTSPEELLAAAHASCFSMALSKQLADNGATPRRIETAATVTFVPGTGVTKSALEVAVTADGLDDEILAKATGAAKEGCPISQALAGNVEITLDARIG
ncbi:MAG: OsmC family peroxiredoxin [Nitriliruptoraceae bacterium]